MLMPMLLLILSICDGAGDGIKLPFAMAKRAFAMANLTFAIAKLALCDGVLTPHRNSYNNSC